MADPLVLYSVNTLLAYRINERFYGQVHHVWCSPFFSASSVSPLDAEMPPSSTPCDLWKRFLDDIGRQDWHSASISRNKSGLQRGMELRRSEGFITARQQSEIEEIVKNATFRDFRPLLYVIPFHGVRSLVQTAPLQERAHPFSPEYTINRLTRSLFDVLEWPWR